MVSGGQRASLPAYSHARQKGVARRVSLGEHIVAAWPVMFNNLSFGGGSTPSHGLSGQMNCAVYAFKCRGRRYLVRLPKPKRSLIALTLKTAIAPWCAVPWTPLFLGHAGSVIDAAGRGSALHLVLHQNQAPFSIVGLRSQLCDLTVVG